MRFSSSAVLGLLWVLGASPCPAEVVDRIVAVVDREVITRSETELARDIGAIRGGDVELTLAVAVERLIETRLIEREIRRYRGEPVAAEQVSQAVDAIRDSFPSNESFLEALAEQGMSEEALRQMVRRQIAVSQYLERRFRPLVHVTDEEVEAYFQEELLPALLDSGGAAPVFEDVAERIRQIVAERKFNQRVDDWIEDLKSRSRIRRYVW
jgi:hypothetical protein